MAAFCLLRAFLNTTDKARGAAERWLNMLFGCFVLVYDTIFTAALMFDDASRDVYAAQKGGHLEGDLEDSCAELTLDWAGHRISVGRIRQADVAARFGFVGEPT